MKNSKINNLKVFPTIDSCVMYLTDIGCKWDYKKEEKLVKNSSYTYDGVLVLYDPYDILA